MKEGGRGEGPTFGRHVAGAVVGVGDSLRGGGFDGGGAERECGVRRVVVAGKRGHPVLVWTGLWTGPTKNGPLVVMA
jgi:hypothetical protein